MSESNSPEKNERSGTYVVQDRKSGDELARLQVQAQMVTLAMGGVLPEQENPGAFRRVLDVGCGPAGWIIEAAQTYPHMQLFGIDISQRMIEYGRAQAEACRVSDRVELRVMDALLMLEFPTSYFDLVNLRFGVSFLRTWDWPKMLNEMVRVTSSGGVIRLVEGDIVPETTSPALTRFAKALVQAFYRAGNLFEPEPYGVSAHLAHLLHQHGRLQMVQERRKEHSYRAGEPMTRLFAEDMQYAFRTLRQFLQKWGALPDDYDALSQQASEEMQRPDFAGRGMGVTAWGVVPGKRTELHDR